MATSRASKKGETTWRPPKSTAKKSTPKVYPKTLPVGCVIKLSHKKDCVHAHYKGVWLGKYHYYEPEGLWRGISSQAGGLIYATSLEEIQAALYYRVWPPSS